MIVDHAAADWAATLGAALQALGDPTLLAARVFGERRGSYSVRHGEVVATAGVAGRLRHLSRTPGALPVVGDWVAIAPSADRAETATIRAVLPRRTVIARRAAGERDEEQVLAANVDIAAILMGLDGDFNLRRLERYLTMVRSGRAEPLVLLTKADLAPQEGARRVSEVLEVAPETSVAAAALTDEAPLPELFTARLRRDTTVVFLGSSGVGKSTLVNRLAGQPLQRTGAVRASDSRGRHTTSYRQMFELPGGALVIDTPGLREIQLVDDIAAGIEAVFPEILAAGAACRFRDCGHRDEPGCALPAAVLAGTVLHERLASYRRLADVAAGKQPVQQQQQRRKRSGTSRRSR